MTNRLALLLLVLLGIAAAFDYRGDWRISIFLGQKLLELMDAVAVWR